MAKGPVNNKGAIFPSFDNPLGKIITRYDSEHVAPFFRPRGVFVGCRKQVKIVDGTRRRYYNRKGVLQAGGFKDKFYVEVVGVGRDFKKHPRWKDGRHPMQRVFRIQQGFPLAKRKAPPLLFFVGHLAWYMVAFNLLLMLHQLKLCGWYIAAYLGSIITIVSSSSSSYGNV